MIIGILALQGGYAAHAQKLTQLGISWVYVRRPNDLEDISGLILPGGESPTMLLLALQNGLFVAIKEFKKPIFGTCAGAILLAKQVTHPDQTSLGLIDVTVERNAYGRQMASHIVHGKFLINNSAMEMVFIRAPRFKELSSDIKVLATYNDEAVCIQQDNCLAATFHPELSRDMILHQYFVDMVKTHK
jgi:pyridoxal 5'-phosphate synthase pdxT subunit